MRHAVESELQASGGRAEEVVPHKTDHEETLWEYLHRYRFWADENASTRVVPLLVFDQFEEIFTLEKDHHRVTEFFAQVADLLNSVMPDYLTADENTLHRPRDLLRRDNRPLILPPLQRHRFHPLQPPRRQDHSLPEGDRRRGSVHGRSAGQRRRRGEIPDEGVRDARARHRRGRRAPRRAGRMKNAAD